MIPPLVSDCDSASLDRLIADKMERLTGTRDGTVWKCQVCERRYKDKTKMKHHIETHLDSVQPCPLCSQTCKTRRTLKTHMARAHHTSASELDRSRETDYLVVEYPSKGVQREQDENSNPFEPAVELSSE